MSYVRGGHSRATFEPAAERRERVSLRLAFVDDPLAFASALSRNRKPSDAMLCRSQVFSHSGSPFSLCRIQVVRSTRNTCVRSSFSSSFVIFAASASTFCSRVGSGGGGGGGGVGGGGGGGGKAVRTCTPPGTGAGAGGGMRALLDSVDSL